MRILYVHNAPTRFVKIDLQLLQQNYQVTEHYLPSLFFNPVHIANAVNEHDIVIGWFASWHTFLPVLLARIFGKPSILMVGGYDTAKIPVANYGSQRGGLRRWIANTTMRLATRLIAFSESAELEIMQNVGIDPDKISVIYLGVPDFMPGDNSQREKIVLTVGGVWRANFLRKGLLPFVQAAAYLPDVKFVHVGKWYDESIHDLQRDAGPNVEFKGFVSDKELNELYARSAVYVQASLHEGFGMSVAEAMLAGCIPVVTRNGSLPEVVGDTGVFCTSNEPPDVAAAVKQALAMADNARKKTRERILNEFPESRREEALNELISSFSVE